MIEKEKPFDGVPIGNLRSSQKRINQHQSHNKKYEPKQLPPAVSRYMPEDSEDRKYLMNELVSGYLQLASGSNNSNNRREAGDHMDDGVKMLIERMERDSREREERYHKDSQEREARYREEMQSQDQRLRKEAQEREERILNAINDMKTDIRSDFQDVKDESRTTRNTVIGLTVSIVLGVAAMVIAVIFAT